MQPAIKQDPVMPAAIVEAIRQTVNSAPYPKLLGMEMEEIRQDYSRMRLRYRPELNQPAGIVHGGAIASLIDTAVVGALFSGLEKPPRRAVTLDMHIHYLDAAIEEDVIAEATVRRRGRSVVFLSVDATTDSGKAVAHGELSYRVIV